MSEGSRSKGPAGPGTNGSGSNGSNGSGSNGSDDFYATVSTSAGANRSTRIRHGESGGQPGAEAAESSSSGRAQRSWTDPTPVGEPTDAAAAWTRPAPEVTAPRSAAAEDTDATAARPESLPGGGDADASPQGGKSWRDRWNSITAAVTGKQPKVSSTGTPLQTVEESQATDELLSGAEEQQGAKGGLLSRVGGGSTNGSGSGGATKSGKKPTPYELATARLSGSPETSAPARVAQPEAPAIATIPVAAGVSASATAVKSPEAAAVAAAPAAAAPKPKVGAARRTRKARLRLSRLDPWSVMKTAFLFSIAAGIVLVVAVYVVWTVIGSSGLFASVNDIVGSVVSTPGDTTPFRVEEYVNTQKVMGVTAFIACIDVVIFTALATLASFLYNLAATMLGGLEVTLAED